MKRAISAFICFALIGCVFTCPVKAAGHTDTYSMMDTEYVIISQTVEDLGNDCYFIETIYIPCIQTYSNTRTGTKNSTFVVSGTSIFTISVTGTFSYDGSIAEAISASGSIAAHVDGVTLNSRRAYTSGASAVAACSVTYNRITIPKTVTLTCDKNGNLS